MARRSLILAAALAAACGTNDDTAPVALRVTLSSPSVAVGRTVLATAAGIDRDGDLVALPGLTWSTSRPDLATVDANGTVTGLAVGDVEVQATTGALSATATLHVALDPTAACRLRGPARGIGLGIPRIEGRLPSTGSVHVVVLLVDFSDAVATRAPRDVFAMISPAAEQRFAALSYGRMRMFLDPVLVWLRMSKPSTAYGWPTLSYADQKAYLQEAVQLAGGRLASTQPSAVVVLANPDASALSYGPAFTANPGEGILVNGQVVDNGATSGADLLAWGSGWLNHELGHTLSLVDLYELDAMPEAQFHYTGDFSLMGNILGVGAEYLGWERWEIGRASCRERVSSPV